MRQEAQRCGPDGVSKKLPQHTQKEERLGRSFSKHVLHMIFSSGNSNKTEHLLQKEGKKTSSKNFLMPIISLLLFPGSLYNAGSTG